MTATLRSPFNLSAHLRPTVGDQKMTYVGVDHMGWMLCDGRAVSRVTYALLFNVIGTTFGVGDGSTTFNLPDFRGMVPGMAGKPSYSNDSNNINPTDYAIGDKTGEQRHRLTIDEMPRHTHGSADVTGNTNGNGNTTLNGLHSHTATDSGHTHPYINQSADQSVFPGVGETAADQADNPATTSLGYANITVESNGNHNHQIFNTGGSNYHNNMQPTLFAGNMFIYSGRNMDAYFPYTWVGGTPGNVQVY